VHNDLVELRQEAASSLKNYIDNLPFEWAKSRTSIDLMIRHAYDMLKETADFDQRVEVMKIIINLAIVRLNVLGDGSTLNKAYEHQSRLRAELERLKKEKPKWDVITEETPEGKKQRVGVKLHKSRKKKEAAAIV
jgi:hypothetical protein